MTIYRFWQPCPLGFGKIYNDLQYFKSDSLFLIVGLTK